ncbi:MAG: chitobiase/beta-hexosaminidase C-terminal domain-containing protein, partial [Kiritimatiellae bacterium]|nr:chitobiase/beta-hexosaminidase C-terminal domain-containing protein [Kiritimatiellia bacterium]
MRKIIMMCCGIVFAACAAMGEVVCSGSSAAVELDLTSGTRTATLTERIRYSTEWVEGAGADAVAVVEVGGVALSADAGNGFVDWIQMTNGVYTLTHKVMRGDTQIGGTLAATFRVTDRNPIIYPADGTTFEGSLSVSIACPTEGAMIRYTTDGSDPTAESPVYRRFKISGKTTVRAVAERDGLLSEVVVAEYALGKCTDPVISLADGTVFEHSDQAVSIQWNEDGVLRYTLDGSDPTAESPVYGGPFTLSESTVVKAKVFSDSFFDSSIVTASLTRVWVNAATPQIKAVSSFIGSKAEVTLSCATEGALILYTLNGNEPNSHSTKYTGPFYVNKSCTVKAYAVAADYLNSGVATFSIEKVWGIGDAMGDPDQTFTTGGNLPFFHVSDATAPNGEAMRSGQITHNQISTLTTTVKGPG